MEFWEGRGGLDSIEPDNNPGGPESPWFKVSVKTIPELCAWVNLPLHLREYPSFTAFMRTVDPRYSQISWRSVMRFVEEQADEVVNSTQAGGTTQKTTKNDH